MEVCSLMAFLTESDEIRWIAVALVFVLVMDGKLLSVLSQTLLLTESASLASVSLSLPYVFLEFLVELRRIVSH